MQETTCFESDKVSVISTEIQRSKLESPSTEGLNVLKTCFFIVGIIAGTGFLTLPQAVDYAGWIGFILIVLCCFVSAYTGDILGDCWTIVSERHPEYRVVKVGYPYPAIGQEAYGKIGRMIISFSINFTQFGATVVYVLLASENIMKLLPTDSVLNCCYVTIIIGGVMTPFTWLRTPKDFWGIAAVATFATGTASIILLVDIVRYGTGVDVGDVQHTTVDVVSLFTAYGTICFAFNGHPAFPTFQADMKEPRKFGKSLVLGYMIVLLMYLPSSVAAYFIYGKKVEANVLNAVPNGPAATIVSVLMTVHLLLGIVIVINPLSQELDHLFHIPQHFTWRRMLSRSTVMATVMFVAVSVPHFSSILSLVGGSTISILGFICPPLFYMKLCRARPGFPRRPIALHKMVLLYEIVVIGVLAGIAATYSAITDLAVNHFTVPCYVNPSKACPKH